jgi:HNH endonuclease
MIPLSAERVALQITIATSAHENLRYAQALLGHDLAEVIERASELIVREAEKQRFAASSRPHSDRHGSSADPRRIPAAVKRAVWLRDRGQCGFVSEAGQRCPATTRLEFDHVDPVARGGEATVENLRVRCRTHNQFEAEAVFGVGFMSEKREAAMRAAAARRAKREGDAAERTEARRRAAAARAAEQESRARAVDPDPEKDVTPWLLQLGVRAEQARRLAESCDALPPETSLEERIRFAVRQLAPPHCRRGPSPQTAA